MMSMTSSSAACTDRGRVVDETRAGCPPTTLGEAVALLGTQVADVQLADPRLALGQLGLGGPAVAGLATLRSYSAP